MLNKDTKLIAVCSADINADYNDNFLLAFSELACRFNFKILFFNSFSSLYTMEKHDIGESNIFQLINYQLIDGMVLLSETIKNDEIRTSIAQKAIDHHIPVISIEHPIDGCFNIGFDYSHTMAELITHLINDHHCKRINFIAGIKGNPFSEERLQVYRDLLTSKGIPVEEERIAYGEFWSVPTRKAVDQFLNSNLPFPDAIVCANDSMAIATIKYLTEAGYRVPEDVAVTGFDGIDEALEHIPPITTVQYDFKRTVQKAFQILSLHFEGQNPPKQSQIVCKIIYGSSCGCEQKHLRPYNKLVRKLHDRLDDHRRFNNIQITMAADLTDNDSFQSVFTNLMKYADNFCSHKFWLCIVDDFLNEQEELSDIIVESSFKRIGYSNTMDLMLSRCDGEWQGITDFHTENLLPRFDLILESEDNLMFLPLHVLEQTIGYVVLVYDASQMNMSHAYQFLMNISNALEITKTHRRQQTIIANLENKYVHDPMTGLFNRRGFYQRVQPLYDRCIKEQHPIMIISADLNGLKQINDTFGHADGDIAISTVGKALSRTTSADSTCARFGGDEFVAVCLPVSDEETAFRKRVEEYLKQFNCNSNKPYEVSASIGIITAVPNENISLDEFIKFADEKMYEEKAKHHLHRKA